VGAQRASPSFVLLHVPAASQLPSSHHLRVLNSDSQMKGLYLALKCFMLEFWDLKQYAPTWNATTLDSLNKLPRNAEARCIHLPQATRICQLKVRGFVCVWGF
jgi:hypothetical protein